MDTSKRKFSLLPLLLCVGFAVLARAAGVAYSLLATDVAYSAGALCLALPYVRQVLSAMSFAAAMGAAAARICGHSSVKAPAIVYAGVLLADGTAVILYDLLSGVLEGRVLLALLYRAGLMGYSLLMLLIGIGAAVFLRSRNKSVRLAAAAAAVIPPAVDLVTVLYRCVSSLIEWEFLPYADEVVSMSLDIGTVVISGVLSATVAAACAGMCRNTVKRSA